MEGSGVFSDCQIETTYCEVEDNVSELVFNASLIGSVYVDAYGKVFAKRRCLAAFYANEFGSFDEADVLLALEDLGPVLFAKDTFVFKAFPGRLYLKDKKPVWSNFSVVPRILVEARLQEFNVRKNMF